MARMRRIQSLFFARDGATAVEFAIIAPIFFTLLIGMAEIGSLHLVQSGLNIAVVDTARLIRTGEAQRTNLDRAAIAQRVCDRVIAMLPANCEERIRVDVDSWPDFAGADLEPPLNEEGEVDVNQLNYAPGEAGAVVLVRVYYEWPVITPMMSQFLSNMPGDRRLIVSSALFRNEPFGELQL